MFKTIPLITFAVWLFAGAAQAGAPDTQADQAHSTLAQQEAPTPTARVTSAEAAGKKAAKKTEQELSPNAGPVYLDGGYFGGEGGK